MFLTTKEKISKLLNFNFKVSDELPSVWSEKHRMMSSEVSNFTGSFSYDRTPYTREIIDNLSPYSPINYVAIMKGLQIGLSAGVIENGIAYIIGEHPTNVMLVSGDAGLVPKMMTRIDQAIDTCGLRDMMGVSTKRKSKATGDTATEKRFAGGSLISYGGQAINKMRQNSVKVIFADDCEAFKGMTNAGSFTKTMEGRAASYGNSKKIFFISTPEEKETSIIEPIFEKGDQRYFFVPCPCCGAFIKIEWFGVTEKGDKYGIMFDVKDGRVVTDTVRYRCPECLESFKEGVNKTEMLLHGEWRPTAIPTADNYRSYHISSLYAPIGMNNWTTYAVMFNSIYPRGGSPNIPELKSFNTNYLGLTWEDKGESPKAVKIQNNTRSYESGTVPHELSEDDGNGEIAMLTLAADLNGFDDDARIDWEICAHSKSGSTYSVDHGSIGTFLRARQKKKEHDTGREKWSYKMGHPLNVWDEMTKVIENHYSGMKIHVSGIDVGNFTNYANGYIYIMKERGYNIVPLKGDKDDSFRSKDDDNAFFRKSKKEKGLYLVNGNAIKNDVSRWMKLDAYEVGQPPNFMNFPNPVISNQVLQSKYTYKEFFSHFEGERKVLKSGSNGIQYYLWERKGMSNNHFWDCFVYNIALREILGNELFDLAKQSESIRKYVVNAERNWNNMAKLATQFPFENQLFV
jgi:phage terminase large subunit GpA-like protein